MNSEGEDDEYTLGSWAKACFEETRMRWKDSTKSDSLRPVGESRKLNLK